MTTKKTVPKKKVTTKKPNVTIATNEAVTSTPVSVEVSSIGIDKVGNLQEVLEDLYKNVNLHQSALEDHNDRFSEHFHSLVDLTVKLNGSLVSQENINNGLVKSIEITRVVETAEAKKLLSLTKTVAATVWVSAALWISLVSYLIFKH